MSEHCNCGHEHDENCACGAGADIITLVDEENVEHQFEIADVMELDESVYMALIPVAETPEDVLEDSGELVILKVAADGVEEFLEVIEDEDEFERVSAAFIERLSDEYDFAEASDEE